MLRFQQCLRFVLRDAIKNSMRRAVVVACTIAILVGMGPVLEASAAPNVGYLYLLPVDIPDQDLDEIADNYISKYRMASIRRKFHGQHLFEPLRLIKSGSSASHKQAWKLLNDNRFSK